jgi:GNAT superfamily N-acetyltransferase
MVEADAHPITELVTTYLHMPGRADFRPAFVAHPAAVVLPLATADPDLRFYRFLYTAVGEAWRWRDRNLMPDDELRARLREAHVYVLYVGGAPAGYVELAPTDAVSTEIAYFGLRPEFFGLGLGKHLLSYGVEQAWQHGAGRVWVHTCNLDGPHALSNYQKRGFSVYDVVREPLPERFV